ncbi:hypothetical protein, partial [Acinetobacter lwoffii]|uniref:hypothetical protein n=1 Tax=Acinetobacter lwoffii TaxID=28090 RepID=UPI001BB17304
LLLFNFELYRESYKRKLVHIGLFKINLEKKEIKIMSSFLIIIGFILCFTGIIFGPHILHKKVKNYMDAQAAGFLCMLPSVFIFCLGSYLR